MSMKAFPSIWRTEWSQNIVLLMSTQATIKGTTHYSVGAFASTPSHRADPLVVAHKSGSGKLYICLSNKRFMVYPVYSLCTDVRPSQDHQILCMQMVRINLAAALLALDLFAYPRFTSN